MTNGTPLGIGLIGCGGFGEFCLDAFSAMDDVRVAAVADVYTPAADRLGAKFGVPAFGDPAELIARDDVGLVHIATPPASHHELALAAIRAGKHVLCEKPLATSVADADEIVAAAAAAGVICPVNFVLRYNAVTEAVKAVIDSAALGRVLSARLTNCASDSKLPAEHWFWDKAVSGGIFIEHAVHFFDLYAYWFGPGEVTAAHAEHRGGAAREIEDRVACTVRHESGTLSSQYHGFDQAAPMDRQDHRLVCELGDVFVEGWIPLALRIDALVDDETQARLEACCGGAAVEVVATYEGDAARMQARGVERHVTRRIRLSYEPAADKQSVYADSVRALLADQLAGARDAAHARVVTEANGRAAVALAEAAARLAAGRAQ